MALYLKYRPQSLAELIGQTSVKKTLLSAFQANKLSHAYLLVGPRGTGKTSTARILAKMVNCRKPDRQIPCNKCDVCLSITDGSNLDLIEIDAASNRGIDDIRTLRENIKLAPSGNKKKVYIIDEVHMLTTEAFNALLKTLEEPPEHALFILATTDVGKVPQTILSRVQRLDFTLASGEDLMMSLKRIIDGEKIKIQEEALKLLIKKADGSFRDSVKLLDQISSKEGEITVQDIVDNLRTTKFDEVISLLGILAEKKTSEGILTINKMVGGGADIKDLTLSLMEVVRALMLIKSDLGGSLVAPEYGSENYISLVELAKKFELKDLSKGLEALQQALERLKFASILVLPLELAIMEMCQFSVLSSQPALPAGRLSDNSQPVISLPVSIAEQPIAEKPKTEQPKSENRPHKTDNSISPEIALIHDKWTFILETIRPYNFSLEALLRSVKIASCVDGIVTLEVPYSFHQRILETPKSRDLLESVLSDVLGKPAKMVTVLGVRPVRVEDVANVEIAADDEIIRAASEIFEGSLVD